MGLEEENLCTPSDDELTDLTVQDENGFEAAQLLESPVKRIACSRLTRLDLSRSQLTQLPELDDLNGLTRLNLSNNRLANLPESLSSAKRLRVLDISHNVIESFPKVLTKSLLVLRTIDLSYNLLRVVPRPACVQHLTELSANNCNINIFPFWILSERHNLEFLDLSVNPLFVNFKFEKRSVFSASCALMKNINFSNTSFSTPVLGVLKIFPNLEYLDISCRQVKHTNSLLPTDLSAANFPPALKVLHCSNVALVATPVIASSTIEEIFLDNNRLFWIGVDFASAALRVVNLSSCLICVLPENFGDCVNLECLDLSYNNITALPSSFESLTNLKMLDLYGNTLDAFPIQLLALAKITALDVCYNLFEPPSHPWGSNASSYVELREKLRSGLNHDRKNGPAPVPEENQYNDSFSPLEQWKSWRSGSSSSSCSESDEESHSSKTFVPQPPSAVEDEDWSSTDLDTGREEKDNNAMYRDVAIPRDPVEVFENADLFYDQFLDKVPVDIKESPLYYHRIDPTNRLGDPPMDVPMDDVVPGQFDDA